MLERSLFDVSLLRKHRYIDTVFDEFKESIIQGKYHDELQQRYVID